MTFHRARIISHRCKFISHRSKSIFHRAKMVSDRSRTTFDGTGGRARVCNPGCPRLLPLLFSRSAAFTSENSGWQCTAGRCDRGRTVRPSLERVRWTRAHQTNSEPTEKDSYCSESSTNRRDHSSLNMATKDLGVSTRTFMIVFPSRSRNRKSLDLRPRSHTSMTSRAGSISSHRPSTAMAPARPGWC
jgi:hypothetical protein